MDVTEQTQAAGKPGVTVFLEPENKRLEMPRPRTVLQMLNKLGLRPGSCLVIRHPEPEAAPASAEAETGASASARGDGDAPGPIDSADQRRKLRGSLLTHDLPLFGGDVITVRKVASHG